MFQNVNLTVLFLSLFAVIQPAAADELPAKLKKLKIGEKVMSGKLKIVLAKSFTIREQEYREGSEELVVTMKAKSDFNVGGLGFGFKGIVRFYNAKDKAIYTHDLAPILGLQKTRFEPSSGVVRSGKSCDMIFDLSGVELKDVEYIEVSRD